MKVYVLMTDDDFREFEVKTDNPDYSYRTVTIEGKPFMVFGATNGRVYWFGLERVKLISFS